MRHTLATAGAALCTYLWVAIAYPVSDYPGDHANPAFEHRSEAIFAAVAGALLRLAARRVRACPSGDRGDHPGQAA